jgi:hypothetical protein
MRARTAQVRIPPSSAARQRRAGRNASALVSLHVTRIDPMIRGFTDIPLSTPRVIVVSCRVWQDSIGRRRRPPLSVTPRVVVSHYRMVESRRHDRSETTRNRCSVTRRERRGPATDARPTLLAEPKLRQDTSPHAPAPSDQPIGDSGPRPTDPVERWPDPAVFRLHWWHAGSGADHHRPQVG